MIEDAHPVDFESVQLLRLQPGDIVVLRVPRDLSEQDFAGFSDRVKATFPDHQLVLLDDTADLQVFRKG